MLPRLTKVPPDPPRPHCLVRLIRDVALWITAIIAWLVIIPNPELWLAGKF